MNKSIIALTILTLMIFASGCSPFMMGGGNCYGLPNSNNNATYDDSYYDEETTYDDYDNNDYNNGDYNDDDYNNGDYDDGYDDVYYYWAGTYTCYDDTYYSPGYYPSLDLYADGTFYFNVNLGDGMGGIWGTYSEFSEFIELYVEGRNFSGYEGDDTEIIPFWIIDNYTLRLHEKNFGITYANSIFEY